MSTLETTLSMLEAMPENDRIKVMEYTKALFGAGHPENPFRPVSEKQVLSDLERSRAQIADGQGMEMRDALTELGKRHGFL